MLELLNCVEPSCAKARGSERLSRPTETVTTGRAAIFMVATDSETQVVMTRSISPARKVRYRPKLRDALRGTICMACNTKGRSFNAIRLELQRQGFFIHHDHLRR